MTQLGVGNFGQLLGNQTRTVAQGNWAVGSGSTDTVINAVLANPSGSAVNLSANIVTALTNNMVEFTSGANLGAMRQIASITTAGIITLDAALAHVPTTGDTFTILNAVDVSVTAPENIAQVGGVDLPIINATPSIPTTQGLIAANNVVSGTAAADATPILLTYGTTLAHYTVPAHGTINVAVALSAAAIVTVTHNAEATSPSYNGLNAGSALAAGAEYAFSVPVRNGDAIDFEVSAAVTLNVFDVWFVPQQ